MMARRLISVILTVILVVPSLYLPTFSKGVDTHPSTSTPPDPFGWGTNKASTGSDATPNAMTTARAVHTATLLPNGKVLVAGGIDASGHAVSSAELYDPTTGIWTATGNMTIARWQHTATLLADGKVLVVGGIDTTASNTTVLSSAELYDPHTGRWTATGSMHNARGSHVALLLSTGRVLVIGGWCNKEQTCILNSAELYDPHTGIWTPTSAMETARALPTATLLVDGRVLVAGGDSTCCQYTAFASAELYDPRTASWSPTSSMHTSRYAHTATRLPNGSVLVVGGSSGVSPNQASVSNAEIYNPSSGTWTETVAMSESRMALTATLLPDGRVLAAGGDNCSASTSCTPLASTELYNPVTGVWASAADMSVARWTHTATLLPNGQVLITGGNTLSCCAWSGMTSTELYSSSTSGPSPTPSPPLAPPDSGSGSCPQPWTCADIGHPASPGDQRFADGTWTISGGGADIWGSSDQFHYVWQPVEGDGFITARITSQTLPNISSKAGVMLRQDTDPDAPNYYFLVSSHDVGVAYRAVRGGDSTVLLRLPHVLPTYVGVRRQGDTFTAYTSTDGQAWSRVPGSTMTISMGTTALAGLAVTAHNDGALSTATFDHVSIQSSHSTPLSERSVVLADAPEAYWPLDETSGSAVADVTGHGHTGVIHGGVVLGASGVTVDPANHAAVFDGVSGYIGVSKLAGLPAGSSPYSIEVWSKISNGRPRQGFVGWGNYGTTAQVNALRTDGPTGVQNYWWGVQENYDLIVGGLPDLTKAWHYIVATYDGKTRRIYFDGLQKAQDQPPLPNVQLENFRLGLTSPGLDSFPSEYLSGKLDGVAIYTYALSLSQIQKHYQAATNQSLTSSPNGSPGPVPVSPIPPSPPVPVGHCPQKETIGGWSFAWASCPYDDRVVDVVVVPPHNAASDFQLDRPYLIVHSLAVTAQDQLVRPVLLPDVPAAVAGFSLTARVLAVDTTNVTIRTGTLFLPAALQGLACYPVPIDDVRIGPDTGTSPGAIRLTQPLQFTYAGARFDVDGLALTRDGLAASSTRMALPGTFGGRGGFAVEHLLIGSDGSVGGTVRLDTDVAIGNFSLHIGTIRIDGDGLTFDNVAGQIPLLTGAGGAFGFHIDNFTFDGTTVTKGHLNAQVSLPMLQFGPGGSWTLHPNVNNSGLQLTVSVVDGVFVYTLTGDASLDLPFIHPPTAQGGEQTDHYAAVDAHLEIGSITWDRPLNLYTFGIKISLPRHIAIGGHSGPEGELPLGDTDLVLTSLGGQVEITGGHNNVIYTVGVNAGIQDLATGGLMLDSRINGTVANDGNFGVSGAATLFLVAHLKGGICVQVTLSNDRVCRDNLGSDASRATGYGTYASLGGAIDVPSTQGGTKHLTLTGNVFGHLWTGLQPSTVQPTPTSTATPPTGGNGRPLPIPNPTPTPSPPSGRLDYHFYGDAKFDAHIDGGYFASVHQIDFLGARTPELDLVPPCPVDAAATGALGTFHYQQDPVPVSGIKAGVTGSMKCPHNINIQFGAHIFYEPPTQVTIGDHIDADYQPQQDQTSELTRGLGGYAPSHRPSRSVVGMAPTGVIGSRSHGTGGALPPLVRSVTIAPGETSTFFTMGWAAGSPTLRVIAPNGTVYSTPRNRRAFLTPVGSGAYWFQSSDPHLLTSSSRAAQALYLVHPQPGIWRVVASGLRARARVHLVVIGDHAAPVVRVTVPGAGQRVPVRPSAPRVPLAGTVQGGSPTGTVGLFYTTNPTVVLHGQTAANLAGTLIADNVPIRHGRWRYSWDTRRNVLRRGRYYIYAQLNDGIGPVAVGYGRGIIQVVQQNKPDAPRRVRVTVARTGRSVVLHWLSPTNDGTVFGYVVRWRRDGVHAPRWTTLHVGRVLAFQFPPLVPRAHYVVEVASYDLSGAQSRATTARFIAPVPRQPRGVRRSQSRPRPHVALGQAYPDGPRPRTVLPSLARNHAHHLALRVVGPTCSINDLAGTPYANAVWREPGPGGGGPEILVGRLDAVLARSSNVRVDQRRWGNYDYAYTGDPMDVMLTARRLPTGEITGSPQGVSGYNKYYNPIIERIGRATGVIAILTAQSVKPKGANRNDFDFDPPGWEFRDSHSTDQRNKGQPIDRGHLLGDVLYGSNLDGRNAVAEYASPNRGAQSNLESTIANDLRDGKWSKVYYRVEPHYSLDPITSLQYVIPIWIEIEAIEVKFRPTSTAVDHSDCIHVDIPNRGDTTIRDVRKLASPIPGQLGQLCQGWPN